MGILDFFEDIPDAIGLGLKTGTKGVIDIIDDPLKDIFNLGGDLIEKATDKVGDILGIDFTTLLIIGGGLVLLLTLK